MKITPTKRIDVTAAPKTTMDRNQMQIALSVIEEQISVEKLNTLMRMN